MENSETLQVLGRDVVSLPTSDTGLSTLDQNSSKHGNFHLFTGFLFINLTIYLFIFSCIAIFHERKNRQSAWQGVCTDP